MLSHPHPPSCERSTLGSNELDCRVRLGPLDVRQPYMIGTFGKREDQRRLDLTHYIAGYANVGLPFGVQRSLGPL